MPDRVVLDASALVDLLLGRPLGRAVGDRIENAVLHGPAHLDAEVLSALGRLHRAGELDAERVDLLLDVLAATPIERHPLPDLLAGAWARRSRVRLVDAVYLELAERLDAVLVTTDLRLREEARVKAVEV